MMIEQLAMNYYEQGAIMAAKGSITPAIDRLEKAVVLDEKHWEAWNVLGLCQYQLGEYSKAKVAWQESLDRCGDDNPASDYLKELEFPEFLSSRQGYNKALELAQKGDYRRAIKV